MGNHNSSHHNNHRSGHKRSVGKTASSPPDVVTHSKTGQNSPSSSINLKVDSKQRSQSLSETHDHSGISPGEKQQQPNSFSSTNPNSNPFKKVGKSKTESLDTTDSGGGGGLGSKGHHHQEDNSSSSSVRNTKVNPPPGSKRFTTAPTTSATSNARRLWNTLNNVVVISSSNTKVKGNQYRNNCTSNSSKSPSNSLASNCNKIPKFNLNPSEGAIKSIITSGSQVLLTSQKMNYGIDKFALCLDKLTGSDGISKSDFHKYVCPRSRIATHYLWDFFTDYSGYHRATVQQFMTATEVIFSQITDKQQINFYTKVFASGKDAVDRNAFADFLLCAYQLSLNPTILGPSEGTNNDDLLSIQDLYGREWLEAVSCSCFHLREDMSVYFLSNWLLTNLPRVLAPMHKYVVHQLTTGYTQMQAGMNSSVKTPTNSVSSPRPETNLGSPHTTIPPLIEDTEESEKSSENASGSSGTENSTPTMSPDLEKEKAGSSKELVPGINPVLMWLLTCSLPNKYLSIMTKPKEDPRSQSMIIRSPKQLLLQLINSQLESEKWTMLYNSEEDGSSINRFQYHVFNYRGPMTMFLHGDNGYSICLASDVEWKESCNFWGNEDSLIIQLLPEFRIIERGPKILYTNFSIRGYPFGIHAGKDHKIPTVEVKPDFQYVSFKQIPCKILQMVVYGCASMQEKTSQSEYKKWEAKQCEKQRNVKLNLADCEWGENPDKYLLELGGAYKSYSKN